jgi:hypothetical protein
MVRLFGSVGICQACGDRTRVWIDQETTRVRGKRQNLRTPATGSLPILCAKCEAVFQIDSSPEFNQVDADELDEEGIQFLLRRVVNLVMRLRTMPTNSDTRKILLRRLAAIFDG